MIHHALTHHALIAILFCAGVSTFLAAMLTDSLGVVRRAKDDK